MDKKAIHVFIRFTILACGAMLLFSACSIFQSYDWGCRSISPESSSKFTRSIRPHRGDVESHYSLARYFQERGKHILAVEEFRAALEIDPTYARAHNGMGVSYDSLGDYDRAVESYQAALQLDQELDYVLNNLAYAYLFKGNLDLAIESFQKAVALDEKNARYRNNLGLAFAENGRYDQAFAEFKLAGGEAKAHRNMARIFYRNGFYDDAADQFTKALAMNPSDKDVNGNLKAANSLARIFPTHEKKRKDVASSGRGFEVKVGTGQETLGTDELVMADASSSLVEEVSSVNDISMDRIYPAQRRKLRHDPDQPGETQVHTVRRGDTLWSVSQQYGLNVLQLKELNGLTKDTIIPGMRLMASEETEDFTDEPSEQFEYVVQNGDYLATIAKESDSRTQRSVQGSSYSGSDTIILLGEPSKPKTEIEISNGNGVRHMARRVGGYLEEKGYEVSRLTNAKHFHFADTRIYYCSGYLQDADQVAKEIPIMKEMMEVVDLGRPYIKVKVLIGKDLVPHENLFRGTGSDGDTSSPMQIANR